MKRSFYQSIDWKAALLWLCAQGALITFVPGCGTSVGNSASTGNFLAMRADLSGAKSLTTPFPTGEAGQMRALLKVTSDNRLENVLEGPNDIQFWKETPTHIIAQVDIQEPGQECHLIAIPKVQHKTKVLCLSRERLQLPELDKPSSPTDALRPRFDIRGSEVYFAHIELQEGEYAGGSYWGSARTISELRYWNGKTEVATTVAKFSPNEKLPSIQHVFASPISKRTCFGLGPSYYSSVSNGGAGMVVCRVSDTAKWKADPSFNVSDTAVKQGSWVLSGSWKFDLETFKSEPRSGYELPSRIYTDLEDGGFIGTSGSTVSCVDKKGDTIQTYSVNRTTQLVRIGNEAWFYGANSLRKVSLKDCSLDAHEYYDNTDLMQISSIAWQMGDFLRITGTDGYGHPALEFMTSTGQRLFMKSEPMVIDHPIDLHWEL